jgi:hypothetical protein
MSTLRLDKTGSAEKKASVKTPLWSGRTKLVAAALAIAAVTALAATAVTRSSNVRTATIPAGTTLMATLGQTISTERGEAGQPVQLETSETISLGDGVTIPAGMTIHGEVTHTKGGGRIAGAPELTLRFDRLEVDGRDYRIGTDPFRVKGKNDAVESVAEIGGGALVGGIVGAVAGDAVKGAVIGGVIGTGVAVATKGNQIVLPKGQRLRIRLTEPVTVRYTVPEKTT